MLQYFPLTGHLPVPVMARYGSAIHCPRRSTQHSQDCREPTFTGSEQSFRLSGDPRFHSEPVIRIEGSVMRALYDSRRSGIVTVAGTEEFVVRMSLLYAPGCFIVHRRRLDGFLPWRRKQRGRPENMV